MIANDLDDIFGADNGGNEVATRADDPERQRIAAALDGKPTIPEPSCPRRQNGRHPAAFQEFYARVNATDAALANLDEAEVRAIVEILITKNPALAYLRQQSMNSGGLRRLVAEYVQARKGGNQ